MKKIIYLLLLVFFNIGIISAKEIILTCEYNKPYDSLSASPQVGILCNIYDNYSHQCYMEVGSDTASTKSNKEKIQNWGTAFGLEWKASNYVKENYKCPDYLLIKIDQAGNGYEIHAAPDISSLLEIQKKLNGQRYPANLTKFNFFENQTFFENTINSYIQSIDEFISNYLKGKCGKKLESNLEKCQKNLTDFQNEMKNWDKVVSGFIDQGFLKENDELYKNYKTAIERAEKFINEEQEKIKKTEEENSTDPSKPTTPSKPNPGDIDDGDLSDICAQESVRKSLRFLGRILMAVKIAIPGLLIILGAIDFMKSITSSNQDALGKASKIFVIRIIIGIVIFIIPTIVNFVFELVGHGNTSYEQCRVCIFNPSDCAKGTTNHNPNTNGEINPNDPSQSIK